LFALFPREQILLLASDALRSDPTGTIRSVCTFLGVPAPAEEIPPRISRPAADIDYRGILSESDVIFLQRQFADEMERFVVLADIMPFRRRD